MNLFVPDTKGEKRALQQMLLHVALYRTSPVYNIFQSRTLYKRASLLEKVCSLKLKVYFSRRNLL